MFCFVFQFPIPFRPNSQCTTPFPDQVQSLSIPDGPKELSDLFRWHQYNANVLLQDSACRSSFLALMEHVDEIEVHENFTGTGNASTSLVQQMLAFKQFLSTELPNGASNWNGFSIVLNV